MQINGTSASSIDNNLPEKPAKPPKPPKPPCGQIMTDFFNTTGINNDTSSASE